MIDMTILWALEKQDAQVVDNQRNYPVLFLGSLLPAVRGWGLTIRRTAVDGLRSAVAGVIMVGRRLIF
jgi:hypothetical protein